MNELQTPPTEEASPLLTELQKINQQWVDACTAAMDQCPANFVTKFTELMFTGQRLITEARIVAQIEAHKSALSQR